MVRKDSLMTLAAIGVLAYVGETLGHELIGHGGVCVGAGGHITALAPLWMRCSVLSTPMVLAGPAFNLAAGLVFAAALHLRRRADALAYALWLSAAFNLLVACGYLIVGGVSGFGDWGAVFAGVQPAWQWRVPAVGVGLVGYLLALRLLSALYRAKAGPGGLANRVVLRRTLLPGAAAAIVACGAEIVGGRTTIATLGLALGCTLFVGWTLGRIGDGKAATTDDTTPALAVPFSPGWVALAVAAGAVFVFLVGPVGAAGGLIAPSEAGVAAAYGFSDAR